MGSFDDGALREEDVPPGRPRPTGSAAAVRHATATRLIRAGSGWEYGEEVDIRVVLNRWWEVVDVGEQQRLYWSGIEVTVAKEHAGDFLVAALFPEHLCWYAHAPLRRTLRRAKDDRARQVAKWLNTGRDLRELSWDPFQQDTGWATARLNDPRRRSVQLGTYLGNGYVRGTGRASDWKGAVWHFGLCQAEAIEAFGLLETTATAAGLWRALAGRREGDWEDTLARRLH
ncbi:MAG: hypothetical protein JNK48_00160, partial [Bryobacterales bacterium]|nr:hypothetical protein [Bryobacterales bacterium]